MSGEKVQETLEIMNMTCKGCARTLENEFRQFKGIDYSVSFPDRNITVRYSPKNYKREDFERVIESHGYRIKDKSH